MEQIQESKRTQKKEKNASATIPIRVKKETAKIIRSELNKLNNKKFGKKLRPDDLIARAIPRLTEEDRKGLQDSTLSGNDKIALLHQEYCSQNGTISRDAFLSKLT